jgi:uncharacterized protein (DUF1697 family)
VAEHVALLRGIAPMNPKMRNAELRRVFEDLGFTAVRTVISSGNVLFADDVTDRAALEASIEAALEAHLGSRCATIVRSRRQIELLSGLDVFDGHDDGPTARANVTFLKRRPAATAGPPAPTPTAEVVAVRNQAVFSVVDPEAGTTSAFMAALERTYGADITTRTWRTVHRIRAAFSAGDR